MLTTQQAAAQLGISAIRIRQLIAEGKLRAAKVGRDWLIAPKDLLRVKIRRGPGRPRLPS